jgi:hypothetical protein
LLAILLWVLTKNPLYAVILVSAIIVISFYPTVRKSWSKPWSEGLTMHLVGTFNQGCGVLALTNKNVTTVLYPLTMALMSFSFACLLLYRRRVIPKEPS